MNGVDYLVGSCEIEKTPLKAYSDEALAFMEDISATLMKSRELRAYPDLTALAFWCRKSNLKKMKEGCPESDKRLGRGLCFHITPGNIPVNFAFSYLFGVLSGCANIVRLPSRNFRQADILCDIIKETLERHPEIKKRTAFIRYQRQDEVTAEFCKDADARLIWGGDMTISTVKVMPAKPRCVDICFADRYSVCVLSGKAMLEAEESRIARLAEDFFNDTYLMDQNACSSPQMICWIDYDKSGCDRFWDAVYSAAAKKYQLQDAVAVDKYTKMCMDAIAYSEIVNVERNGNLLYRARVELSGGDITELRGKGGYFHETVLSSLDELAPYVTEKYQTVTYFGVDPEKIREFVISANLRGIDRICPVGKAMDIGVIWDGFDLVRMLSRFVNVE